MYTALAPSTFGQKYTQLPEQYELDAPAKLKHTDDNVHELARDVAFPEPKMGLFPWQSTPRVAVVICAVGVAVVCL